MKKQYCKLSTKKLSTKPTHPIIYRDPELFWDHLSLNRPTTLIRIQHYVYMHIYIYTCVSACFFANYRPDIFILEGCGNGWRRHLAKKKLMKVQITRGHTRLPAKCCQGCRVLRSQEYLTARASQAALLFHGDLTPPDDIVEYCRWLIHVYKVF